MLLRFILFLVSSVDGPQPPKKLKSTSGASGTAPQLYSEAIARKIVAPRGAGRAATRGANSSRRSLRSYAGEF